MSSWGRTWGCPTLTSYGSCGGFLMEPGRACPVGRHATEQPDMALSLRAATGRLGFRGGSWVDSIEASERRERREVNTPETQVALRSLKGRTCVFKEGLDIRLVMVTDVIVD